MLPWAYGGFVKRRYRVTEALAQIPDGQKRFAQVFRHGSLELELYAPIKHDPQTPHRKDEAYIVVSGKGIYVHGDKRDPFGPGDFLFAEAGLSHRFEDFSDDFKVWVLFYGPDGGEAKLRETESDNS